MMEDSKNKRITILQTTDVHCQVHPHDEFFWENNKPVFRETGGYANLKTKIGELRSENKNSFLLDTGDMFQGSMLSVLTEGKAMIPILNAMNYDLFLPGNWEVVYKKDAMISLMNSLNAPVICANMYHDLGGGKKGELLFKPYYIWHVDGLKIAFIGYNDPLVPKRQSPDYSKGIVFTKPEESLKGYVNELREHEGCDYIFVIAHLGLSQEIALANHKASEGVDFILGADTHERVRKPIECKFTNVVEPGAFGSFIGKLDIEFSDKKIKETYSLIEVNASEINPDKNIDEIIAQQEAPYQADIKKVIGYSKTPLLRYYVIENPIDTLVVNALKWKFPEIDIAISNGFRFCPPKVTVDAGRNIPITMGYLFSMLPVDSIVRTGVVSGKQIKEWMEKELNNVFAEDASERLGGWLIKFKGLYVEFKAFGKKGKRVKKIMVEGRDLEDSEDYTILACEREGDPADVLCRMTNVKNAKNTQVTLHDAVIDYLKFYGTVSCESERNAVATDTTPYLLTQVTGVDYEFR